MWKAVGLWRKISDQMHTSDSAKDLIFELLQSLPMEETHIFVMTLVYLEAVE